MEVASSWDACELMKYSAEPVLRWCSHKELWVLEKGFTTTWKGVKYTIKKGFETDLASIPRVAQGLVPKVGKHVQPAIVHDWFYVHGGITKAEADQMFLDGMKYVGVPWYRRYIMYAAVRVGGKGVWG